MKHRTQKTTET